MDWTDPYEVEDFILDRDEEAFRWEFISSSHRGPAFDLGKFLGALGWDDPER